MPDRNDREVRKILEGVREMGDTLHQLTNVIAQQSTYMAEMEERLIALGQQVDLLGGVCQWQEAVIRHLVPLDLYEVALQMMGDGMDNDQAIEAAVRLTRA